MTRNDMQQLSESHKKDEKQQQKTRHKECIMYGSIYFVFRVRQN